MCFSRRELLRTNIFSGADCSPKTASVNRKSAARQVESKSNAGCRGFSITGCEGSRWCLRRTRSGYGESTKKATKIALLKGVNLWKTLTSLSSELSVMRPPSYSRARPRWKLFVCAHAQRPPHQRLRSNAEGFTNPTPHGREIEKLAIDLVDCRVHEDMQIRKDFLTSRGTQWHLHH